MRYAQINKLDVTNGLGIGVALFVQGCRFHCKNCFNDITWDENGGKLWDKDIEDKFLKLCSREHIARCTILGGEPLLYPKELSILISKIRQVNPNIKIWMYSGYTYEQICNDANLYDCVKNVDVLVDGLYIDELRDLNLKFRGSSNQRLIDVQKSILLNNLTTYII